MKPSIEEIRENPEYELLDQVSYDQVLDFASSYFRKTNQSIRSYLFVLLLFFTGLVASLVWGVGVEEYRFGSLLQQLLYGILISFTIIIPVHEAIHGIVYFLLGARKIRFGAKLSQFAFYAVAEDYVTSRSAFYILALSPFIVLSGLNLFAFFYVQGYAGYTYMSILFFHATMCAGDFALLSYYEVHKDKELFTFDDVKERTSYFYYRKKDHESLPVN